MRRGSRSWRIGRYRSLVTQPHDLIRIIHDTLGDEVKVEVMSEDDGQLLVLRRADAIAFLHAAPHGTEYARRLTQTHRWGTATWQFTLDHDQWPDEPSRHALGRATSAADR